MPLPHFGQPNSDDEIAPPDKTEIMLSVRFCGGSGTTSAASFGSSSTTSTVSSPGAGPAGEDTRPMSKPAFKSPTTCNDASKNVPQPLHKRIAVGLDWTRYMLLGHLGHCAIKPLTSILFVSLYLYSASCDSTPKCILDKLPGSRPMIFSINPFRTVYS